MILMEIWQTIFFSSGIPSNNCVMDNTSIEMETTQVEETLSPGKE